MGERNRKRRQQRRKGKEGRGLRRVAWRQEEEEGQRSEKEKNNWERRTCLLSESFKRENVRPSLTNVAANWSGNIRVQSHSAFGMIHWIVIAILSEGDLCLMISIIFSCALNYFCEFVTLEVFNNLHTLPVPSSRLLLFHQVLLFPLIL